MISYIHDVECEVIYADEFESWWNDLKIAEQEDVSVAVLELERHGVTLRHPRSSGITTSRHGGMRELRIQYDGRPYRVLYIFDPRRNAVLLLGGDKTGNDRWYEENIPKADRIYDRYLKEIDEE